MEEWFNQFSGTIAGLSLIVAIIALIIAYLTLKDQKKSKLHLDALSMVPSNNNIYFGFESLTKPELKISNLGSKAITVTEICLCVGKEKYRMSQSSKNKINIYIEPGKVEYYTYNRDYIIDIVTHGKHKKNYIVCWEITTNNGKKVKCKTNNRVSDFVNVNFKGEYDDET